MTSPLPVVAGGLEADRVLVHASDAALKWLLSLGAALALAIAIYISEDFLDELEFFWEGHRDSYGLLLGYFTFWGGIIVLAWRVYLAVTYRPLAACLDQELPQITVIVPAYNEGDQVYKTLHSIVQCDYPQDKLQLIAVDDGSRDDTWQWMRRTAEEMPGRLQLIQLAKNGGKRGALYQGFIRAEGEVLVTVDSDCELTASALRHLVSPFVRDPRVGAVAGNVRVLNAKQGIIPKMMEVSFTFSFDFIRAGQSRIDTVMTTPGALAAYRSDVLRPLWDAWLNQRFCGKPANIGEDRALTNLVLKNGYHAHFARQAEVYTQVPITYRGLCKMLLRWARSNIRETLVMCGFIMKRFRQSPAAGARLNLVTHVYRMTAGEMLKCWALILLLTQPLIVGPNLVMGALAAALLPALIYLLRYRSMNFLWAFPYMVFWVLGLSWISVYALVTPHRNGWLTRDLGPKAAWQSAK